MGVPYLCTCEDHTAENMASGKLLSEDELGRRWDSCLHDTVLKFGGGLVIGGIFSLLFFRRKAWPLAMGSGFGLGMAYLNCERAVNGIITRSVQ